MHDVPPLVLLAVAPNILVVSPDLPVKSVGDLVQFAKKQTGGISYSSAGNGTTGHLAAELFKQVAKIDAMHVPYKSGPEAVTAVIANTVNFMFFTVPATLPQVTAGRLRALAITGPERSPLAPSIPTVIESEDRLSRYSAGLRSVPPAVFRLRLRDGLRKLSRACSVKPM